MQPKEAWGLDYVELFELCGFERKSGQDGSFMVNAQREMNGMDRAELRNLNVN